MEIFLCGGSSGKRAEPIFDIYLNNTNNRSNILYIPLAMEKEKYSDCKIWFENEIKKYSIKFKMIELSKELNNINLNNFTHIFIGGGNTYKLLKEIKDTTFFESLQSYQGKIWDSSAGAIIFGKDINSCKVEDKNKVNIQETAGYNIVNNYSILCHLNKENYIKNESYLKEYSKKFKTIYLPEDDVIYINKNKVEVLGTQKYIIFDNGIVLEKQEKIYTK